MTVPDLHAGDVLLYRPSGLFGRIIAIKTWHQVAHVEIYIGGGESVASRDGKGVGRYPLRTTELAYVLRPNQPFDLAAGLRWHATQQGQGYGWLDLLQFVGLSVNAKGVVCSPYATGFLRACGLGIFNGEAPEQIAPFQFLTSELLDEVWPHPVPSFASLSPED